MGVQKILFWGKSSLLFIVLTYSIYLWLTGVSLCYKRILLFQCGLLYLSLYDPRGLLNLIVIVLTTLMLWSINSQNFMELQRNPTCYDYETNIFLLSSFIVFNFSIAIYTVISFGFTIILSITIFHDFVSSVRGREPIAFQDQEDLLNSIETKYLKDHFKIPFSQNSLENCTCSICLVNFEDSHTLVMLPECKHVYHEACLDQWLRINSVCPYCRFNVKEMIKQRMEIL